MADSTAFFDLDERIQRFIWAQGWTSLRDAQERAIPLIVPGERDVIISATTAAGKTEAAYLPALTHALQHRGLRDLIVYVSPLKSLINDQQGRLELLCESLELPVWPWHGDVSASQKRGFEKRPYGVLLITPESLEAVLCNRGTSAGALFERTAFYLIDEMHAFIGSERGKQLQSLMHRLDLVLGRKVPRIALSATLGDMQLAAGFLRPGRAGDVAIVESKSAHAELKILVKGYEEPLVNNAVRGLTSDDGEPPPLLAPGMIASHLYANLLGSNNLIFPAGRREVEMYTHLLSAMCAANGEPNQFWPHHGSLSKELRAETERALKNKERPATATCTSTLEMGVDLPAVKSIAQIGTPHSVSALRQRMGRSGRREGEAAILRGYITQDALDMKAAIGEQLRLRTVQLIAMITLLIEGWCEPPAAGGLHLSTLVQQILSLISQEGGISAADAWHTLASPGAPFEGLTAAEFRALLRELGEKKLIEQDSAGTLLHGALGERYVNHYSFYAAFAADEEYRVMDGMKILGTLPVSQLLRAGQRILFAARTWKVEAIDKENRTIVVSRARSGSPPQFSGLPGAVHTRVRERMREILDSDIPVPFLDPGARRFLEQGRKTYRALELDKAFIIDTGPAYVIFTWLGDAANEAICARLSTMDLTAQFDGPTIEVRHDVELGELADILSRAASEDWPDLDDLLVDCANITRQKWDFALTEPLLRKAYASLNLDIEGARQWLSQFAAPHEYEGAGEAQASARQAHERLATPFGTVDQIPDRSMSGA
ncbi:DEAD/DEAH box helicase [Paraburkholderia youngii]|uniref:DEAD/DEAH box helicase n=1 Tax=Paraburkholderia youngii TaxID=2782701 RepID=UPI003D19E57E